MTVLTTPANITSDPYNLYSTMCTKNDLTMEEILCVQFSLAGLLEGFNETSTTIDHGYAFLLDANSWNVIFYNNETITQPGLKIWDDQFLTYTTEQNFTYGLTLLENSNITHVYLNLTTSDSLDVGIVLGRLSAFQRSDSSPNNLTTLPLFYMVII